MKMRESKGCGCERNRGAKRERETGATYRAVIQSLPPCVARSDSENHHGLAVPRAAA